MLELSIDKVGVAQLAACGIWGAEVVGSNPAARIFFKEVVMGFYGWDPPDDDEDFDEDDFDERLLERDEPDDDGPYAKTCHQQSLDRLYE